MAKVYFYYSAMNAGKSTTLLQASYNYIERGMQTLLFAPKIDQRFESTVIYSRIGLKQTATPFDEEFHFFSCVPSSLQDNPLRGAVIFLPGLKKLPKSKRFAPVQEKLP